MKHLKKFNIMIIILMNDIPQCTTNKEIFESSLEYE
jgi:hypothetical protein